VDEILIASDLHPDQHCQCGHLRRSHRPACRMCEGWQDCQAFELCHEHPGVEAWRLKDSPFKAPSP
jgi:hypothetical protein